MALRFFSFRVGLSFLPAILLSSAMICENGTPTVVLLLRIFLLFPLIMIGFEIITGKPKYDLPHWILAIVIIGGILYMFVSPQTFCD